MAVFNIGPVSGASPALADWATNGSEQKLTITANVTGTPTFPTNPSSTGWLYLQVIQGTGGSFTMTWPTAVVWLFGQPPILSTTAGDVDSISLFWDGTTYWSVWGTQQAPNPQGTNVQIFLASGVWVKPLGARLVRSFLMGAGGGGGGGRTGAAASVRCGGGGGGSASAGWREYPAGLLGSTETVTVSNTGGTAGTTAGTGAANGGAGGAGGNTTFSATAGIQCIAPGGGGGGGGTATTGSAGAAGGATTGFVTAQQAVGKIGAAASTTGAVGVSGSVATGSTDKLVNPGGSGGSGGGLTTGNATSAGGTGGPGVSNFSTIPNGGTAAANANGGPGDSVVDLNCAQGGGGGGGGSSGTSKTGGAGGSYGGGGGGGGGSLTGTASGAGGAGGPGFCVVITQLG